MKRDWLFTVNESCAADCWLELAPAPTPFAETEAFFSCVACCDSVSDVAAPPWSWARYEAMWPLSRYRNTTGGIPGETWKLVVEVLPFPPRKTQATPTAAAPSSAAPTSRERRVPPDDGVSEMASILSSAPYPVNAQRDRKRAICRTSFYSPRDPEAVNRVRAAAATAPVNSSLQCVRTSTERRRRWIVNEASRSDEKRGGCGRRPPTFRPRPRRPTRRPRQPCQPALLRRLPHLGQSSIPPL